MGIVSGLSDRNMAFSDLCTLLLRLGFTERIKGSHHIFTKEDIPDIINLQARHDK
ncbi:MAG: type II toxin-antitoxin system HicA family toxin [Sphingobacteriales bacterium]|nr:type II toxin-antitoxin system HicA family toxin [Sphingobacteriales bacterium]